MQIKGEPCILVVDDDTASLTFFQSLLKRLYIVSIAVSGRQALDHIQAVEPDIVILDLEMPELDGYEVLKRLKNNPNLSDIPVIVLDESHNAKNELRSISLGAVDYMHKPLVGALVLCRVKLHMELEMYRKELERRVMERTAQLAAQHKATVDVLAYATDCRDETTGTHLQRTQRCVELIVNHLLFERRRDALLTAEYAQDIIEAAPLHDLGKVTIPDAILLKAGKLTDEEFGEMKLHTLRGAEMLDREEFKTESASLLSTAREIAASHHEKWDGSGYPNGLGEEGIPLSARIMAVADVYDALRTERPYKPPFGAQEAYDIIAKDSGSHFDPHLVGAFKAVSGKLESFYEGER